MNLKLKPSSKIKRRYLLLEVNSKEEIEKAILDYIGVLGWAKSSPFFITTKENKIILAVDRKEINHVRTALELSQSNIKIKRVSGTIKGLRKQ